MSKVPNPTLSFKDLYDILINETEDCHAIVKNGEIFMIYVSDSILTFKDEIADYLFNAY